MLTKNGGLDGNYNDFKKKLEEYIRESAYNATYKSYGYLSDTEEYEGKITSDTVKNFSTTKNDKTSKFTVERFQDPVEDPMLGIITKTFTGEADEQQQKIEDAKKDILSIYSEIFSKEFASELAPNLAKLIKEYIENMNMSITATNVSTINSGGWPCTGVLRIPRNQIIIN